MVHILKEINLGHDVVKSCRDLPKSYFHSPFLTKTKYIRKSHNTCVLSHYPYIYIV